MVLLADLSQPCWPSEVGVVIHSRNIDGDGLDVVLLAEQKSFLECVIISFSKVLNLFVCVNAIQREDSLSRRGSLG